jgi:hypothetical protein
MSATKKLANSFNLEPIGWQYINTKKKAMEQKFSLPVQQTGWSGLLISLSIAFFIVVISASILSFISNTITGEKANRSTSDGLALSHGAN